MTHLVLTARGTAAWQQSARPTPSSEIADYVSKLGPDGRRRTREVAPRGTIAGLRLVRGTIATWTSGAVTHSEKLDP